MVSEHARLWALGQLSYPPGSPCRHLFCGHPRNPLSTCDSHWPRLPSLHHDTVLASSDHGTQPRVSRPLIEGLISVVFSPSLGLINCLSTVGVSPSVSPSCQRPVLVCVCCFFFFFGLFAFSRAASHGIQSWFYLHRVALHFSLHMSSFPGPRHTRVQVVSWSFAFLWKCSLLHFPPECILTTE